MDRIQKSFSATMIKQASEAKVPEDSDTACSTEKKLITTDETDVEDGKVKLEGLIVRDIRDIFTQINNQETKDILLGQKILLEKKKFVIAITRKNLDTASQEAKKEIDNRQDELNRQLDEQVQKINDELKKFSFLETVSEDLAKQKGSLFEKSCYNDMLSVRAMLQDTKENINVLLSIGTKYNALNSVSYEKGFQQLKERIHQFGELVPMEDSQIESETINVKFGTGCVIDYSKKWKIMSVADEGGGSAPCGVTVNPYNDNIYVSFKFGIVVYDTKGNEVKRYKTDDRPFNVTFDKNQRMIAVSFQDNKIKIYDSEGKLLSQFGENGTNSEHQLHGPCDIVSDSENRLYVASPNKKKKRIQVFSHDGQYVNSIQGVKEDMKCPFYIHLNNNKTTRESPRLFVSDRGLNKVLIFDVKDDRYEFIRDVEVHAPGGVCQDNKDNLLVASSGDKEIKILDKDGQHLTSISEPVEALKDPYGLAITESCVLCVTNEGEGKIYFLHQRE